jgi:hypothetical protein
VFFSNRLFIPSTSLSEALSVEIPRGIPSALIPHSLQQFQFSHRRIPSKRKMAKDFSKDEEKVEVSADVESSIYHKAAETTSDGTYIVDTKLQDGNTDASGSEAKEVRTTKDGKTTLIPQPSDDPADPLNWAWRKKHQVLVALTFSALLTDWGMTWGTTLFEAQAETWGMSIVDISNSLSGGIFLQGPGGVLAVPLVQRYGRLVTTVSSLEYQNLTYPLI